MNTMMKRVISLILCFVLVVGYVPVGTFAAEDVEPVASTTEVTTDPTQPSSEETEAPSETTEATEPSTEATEPSVEADELPADKIASDKNAGLPEEVEEEIPVTSKAVTSAGTYSVPGEYAERGFTVEDAAIIFTDLHTNNSGKGDFKKSTIDGIMGNLKNTGLPFTSVTSGGDAFSDNSSASNNCYTDTITGYIQAALGDEDGPSDIPVNYVWSDHDRSAKNNSTENVPLNKKSHLSFENENYYVYSLSMGDIGSYDRYNAKFNDQDRAAAGFTPTVDQAIAEFEAAAAKMDKTRPLLIVSHMPLFNKRNDNAFAEKWYNAINEVAKEMDVFYFYGHNHNHETGNDYYYAKGDTLTVATTGGWYGYQTGSDYRYNGTLTGAKKENINFTHVCGGYMEPTSTGTQSSQTRRGNVMVVVLLQNDEGDEVIHLVTYDNDGKYTGNYALDATVESVYEKTATPEPDPTPDPEPDPDPVPDVIPEGYTLDHLEVVNQGKTKYFRNDALDTENLSVVAVYTMENATDIRKTLTVQTAENEDGYTISGVDMSKAGKQYVTVTYNGSVGSFAIEVFETHFENETGTVAVDFTNYGITTVAITEKAKEVSGYSAYVTYDITPTGYTQGDEATVTIALDTDLFDESRPVKVLDQGAVIATPEIQEGKITFTTNHFSEYDVAQVDDSDVAVDNSKWIEVIPASGGTTTYVYKLDTDGTIDANTKYLIVSANSGNGNALTNNNGTAGSTQVTISNSTIQVTDDSKIAWTFGTNNGGKVTNGSHGLRLSSTGGFLSTTTNNMVVASKGNGGYTIQRQNQNYYVRHNNGSWSRNRTASTLYLYALTDTTTSGGTGATYGQLVGETNYQVILGTTEAAALQAVKNGMTVYYTTDRESAVGNIYDDDGAGMSWTIAGYEPNVKGRYTVTIKYNNVTLGTATVEVVEKTAKDVKLSKYEGTVERDSAMSTETGAYLSVLWEGETEYVQVPVTLDMLDGDFNVNKNGTYTGLSISYGGKTFTDFTLKVVNKTGVDDYPVYPNPGSIDVKKSATGVDFQNTGIARVELSTSGLPYGKGVDVIVMLDTSSSMDRCVSCGQYTGKDSSKGDSCRCTTSVNRIDELKEALQVLEDTLKRSTNADNIRVAVADFNGVVSGATALDTSDRTVDANALNSAATKQVYTGSKNLNAAAFIPATQLDVSTFTIKGYTGTNYDYAFDAIYQLGTAIKTANGENQRPLYVIFMSDGAPNQFNYYGTTGGTGSSATVHDWNIWLQGLVGKDYVDPDGVTRNEAMNQVVNCATHSYYYDDVDHDGDGYVNEHRMANAIKGDPGKTYKVIRKAAGLGTSTNQTNIYEVPGLGATMYSLAFYVSNDGNITEASAKHALSQTASQDPENPNEKLYVDASSGDALKEAFNTIGSKIANAAENARYVDQMGDSFNLQMNPNIKTAANTDGYTTTNTDIVITTRPVYTEEDADAGRCEPDDIGKPYGSGTPLETVSFNVSGEGVLTAVTTAGGYKLPDGTEVEANKTNILVGGVICGKNFFYNNNNAAVTVKLANGSTYSLPGETFYWNIGIINEVQYTISYTVYLEGSLDGYAPPAASYETNNFAVLYYTNHVGNEVSKSVASPSLAWLGANVSYAFYLVDSNGNPLYADGTAAPNFLQAHKLTQPVVYDNQLLLNDVPVTLKADALAVLPQGYSLYDLNATYTVKIQSGDAAGAYWQIGGDKPASTYVVGYEGPNDYSNEQNAASVDHPNYDYTHTTVYFAVQWIVGAVQDTVVIDYGLSVDVNVMYNDMFLGAGGTLYAVGKRSNKPDVHGTNLADGFNTKSVNGDFGTAEIKDGKIRYTLSDMDINNAEKLAYAVDYKHSTNGGYYYGDLTIIPATTVYYEDEFVDLKTAKRSDTTTKEYTWTNGWPVNSVAAGGTQAEDRPGMHNLPVIDANNGYGYDQAYDQMSTHSMGNAAMIHVNALQYGTAEFTFWGTGFDVVSTTSNDTGTLVVQVYKAGEENPMQSHAVDTYYGYAYGLYTVTYEVINGLWTLVRVGDAAPADATRMTKAEIVANARVEEGNTASGYNYAWKPVGNDPNALYQVPVMQYSGLPYDQYTVKITALYYPTFDATEAEGYDLYLDAIRIYDPAGNGDQVVTPGEGGKPGTTIRDVYAADGELWPEYHELRTRIIEAGEFDKLAGKDKAVEGIIFIDGDVKLGDGVNESENVIDDYTNFGPNNELYLASGQAVAFDMHLGENMVDDQGKLLYTPVVRIGLKTVGGKTAVAEMWNAQTNGDRYNAISDTLLTATDMYYDITVLDGRTVVIRNSGQEGSILSITNIKVTYKPATTSTAGINDATANNEIEQEEPLKFSVSKAVAEAALLSLAEPVQEEIPEDTVPSEPDNSELQIAVAEAKQLKEKNYTKASFKAVKTALKAAEKVVKKANATQAEIDAALKTLKNAIADLVALPNNSALKTAVADAKKLKEANFTKESFAAFKKTLKAAEKILKNKKATQSQIDRALAELNEAVNALSGSAVAKKPGKGK